MIPNVFHFIYLHGREFSMMYYLAIRSVSRLNSPDKIFLYVDKEPDSLWFEAIRPLVQIEPVEPPKSINSHVVWCKQHQADYIRLTKLLERGGVYMDLDVLSLKPLTPLFNTEKEIIMGLERPEFLCNAVIIARPESRFIRMWLDKYESSWGDGTLNAWYGHSIKFPYLQSLQYPDLIDVLPESAFFPFQWNNWAILTPGNNTTYPDSYTVHFWETELEKARRVPNSIEYLYEPTPFASLFAPYIPDILKLHIGSASGLPNLLPLILDICMAETPDAQKMQLFADHAPYYLTKIDHLPLFIRRIGLYQTPDTRQIDRIMLEMFYFLKDTYPTYHASSLRYCTQHKKLAPDDARVTENHRLCKNMINNISSNVFSIQQVHPRHTLSLPLLKTLYRTDIRSEYILFSSNADLITQILTAANLALIRRFCTDLGTAHETFAAIVIPSTIQAQYTISPIDDINDYPEASILAHHSWLYHSNMENTLSTKNILIVK
jgi:hypothetical protein